MSGKICKIIAATTVAAAVTTTAAQADFRAGLKDGETIIVGTTGSAPPFTMINDKGELDGFDIAVMKRAAADLGVKVEFVQLDWAGLLPGLIAGRFDVVSSGVSRTAERLNSPDLIMASPYIINGVAVTRLTSNEKIQSWDDVCDTRVGVVRGAVEMTMIKTVVDEGCNFEVVDYPGWTEILIDLKNGRIQWAGSDYLGPSYMAKKDPNLTVLPEMRAPKTQSVAISPSDPELAKALDELITRYREDGTLNEMVIEYFGQGVDFSNMPADPVKQ